MQRPTLATFRQSRGPAANGLCTADLPGCAALVNEAQERLLKDPMAPEDGWWGTWARMRFDLTATYPYVTAPREVARLVLMDVGERPTRIQNGFFEFLDFGAGLQPKPCQAQGCQLLQAYDRDVVPTLVDFSAGQTIQLFPMDQRDVGKRVLFGATDLAGNTIYTQDGLTRVTGQFATLATPFAQTGPFGSLTSIQKDVTADAVNVFAVDGAGNQTLLATLRPGEQVSGYRRYLINGVQNRYRCAGQPIQVTAMAKLDFVPVSVDTDFLLIRNVPALIEEGQAIRYWAMDSPAATANADHHHAKALALLAGELDHFLGRERPAINVPLFGSDWLQDQPV